MIQTHSLPQSYTTAVTDTRHEMTADAPIDKGGGGAGFGAHELLEAALAACINMAVRMHADTHAIPLDGVTTRVMLHRSDPETARFEYALEITGSLSLAQREQLATVARSCPVRRTLSKRLEFQEIAT